MSGARPLSHLSTSNLSPWQWLAWMHLWEPASSISFGSELAEPLLALPLLKPLQETVREMPLGFLLAPPLPTPLLEAVRGMPLGLLLEALMLVPLLEEERECPPQLQLVLMLLMPLLEGERGLPPELLLALLLEAVWEILLGSLLATPLLAPLPEERECPSQPQLVLMLLTPLLEEERGLPPELLLGALRGMLLGLLPATPLLAPLLEEEWERPSQLQLALMLLTPLLEGERGLPPELPLALQMLALLLEGARELLMLQALPKPRVPALEKLLLPPLALLPLAPLPLGETLRALRDSQ